MTLLAVGINHKTAPVALREQIAFTPDKLEQALSALLSIVDVNSAVVLSTCNRTELYLSVEDTAQMQRNLLHWLHQYHELKRGALTDSLYWYHQDDAIYHLMRVASGLDSLVLGEPQILGQVKKAYTDAVQYHGVNPELAGLFQKSFSVAKRVRTETGIGENAVSVAFAACTLARQIFESLSTIKVLLVGSGATIALVARHLQHHSVKQLTLANRTRRRAEQLAQSVGATVIEFSDIPSALAEADIIISSTASPLPIIGKGMVERALKQRRNQPMLFVDIAVPRDVESEVADLPDAYLYTVDDLHAIIEKNRFQRQTAALEAEAIVRVESLDFIASQRARAAAESICDYRRAAEQVCDELQARAHAALAQGQNAEQVLNEFARRLTNRLIHTPTKSMQQAAREGDADKLQIIRDSLGLN